MNRYLALALLSAIAAPAFAADKPFYVAADYGTLSMSNVDPLPNPGAIRVAGGYRFTPNIALEAGYMMVGDSTASDSFGSITYTQSALQAFGVFTLPLNSSFDLFGKLGVSANTGKLTGTGSYAGINGSYTNSDLAYGIGGQFNINQLVGIRLQYESYGKSKAASSAPGTDLTRVSAGVAFSF